MSSVNKAILIGHLGADPEMRYSPSGDAIANIRLATSETWKDKDGVKQSKTEWHRVVFFGKLAEIVGQYLRKGSLAYVDGKIQTRKWRDKEGQDRYSTEIVADCMQLLGGRGGDGNKAADDNAVPPIKTAPGGFDDMQSDIPF